MIPLEGLLKAADLDVRDIAAGRQLCAWIHLQVTVSSPDDSV